MQGCFHNIHAQSSTFPAQTSRLSIRKVVHAVKIRSPGSKVVSFQYESKLPQVELEVATFQFQSSTPSALPQLQLASRAASHPCVTMPGLAGRNLSRILRQTLAKIRPGSCTQLDPKASKLLQADFCWGLLLQRSNPQATLSPTNFSLCAFCAHCRQKIHTCFIIPSSCSQTTITQNFRGKKHFRNPLRGTFPDVNAKTKRSSPS